MGGSILSRETVQNVFSFFRIMLLFDLDFLSCIKHPTGIRMQCSFSTFESKTASAWLNHTVWTIRTCFTFKTIKSMWKKKNNQRMVLRHCLDRSCASKIRPV